MNEKWLHYIRTFEGFAPLPYQCPSGCLTVGYGHNLEVPMLKEAALALLEKDALVAQKEAQEVCSVWARLNPPRQFVLVDMCFNMGRARLKTFKKMLAALACADYQKAAEEMLRSRWASQVGRRAKVLSKIMETGEYV